MAYIGKEPIVGNFQVCDAISVVNGQAAYTMQVSSVNVTPESANHMLVSLNGILQKPGSSFTISGSTITFASALATGDVIDFIMLLGNVLDLGVPSDATVTDAKANFVSTSSGAGLQIKGDGTTDGTLQLNCSQNSHGIKLKSPAHSTSSSYTLTFPGTDPSADKFLKTDGSGNLSFADAGGGAFTHLLTTTASDSASVAFNSTYITTTYLDYQIIFSGIKASADAKYPILYFSTDNGSSYLSSYQDIRQSRKSDGNQINSNSNSTSSMGIIGSYSLGDADGEIFNAKITIFDPLKQSGTTDARTMYVGEIGYVGSDGNLAVSISAGMSAVDTAINNIKFQMNSGNIESGKISLYGRKIS